MDTALSILVGIGLSSACGFRVFVPLLVISIASQTGHLALADGFQWIATPAACAAFGTAALCEIAAYSIPWFDHLMDTIATPAAFIAGTVATASMVGDLSPWLTWSLATITGGGVAGAIQAGTVAVRGASTMLSGGLGNPGIAILELLGAAITSVLAVVAPVVAVTLIALLLVIVLRRLARRTRDVSAALSG
jgi:hypothetical protein